MMNSPSRKVPCLTRLLFLSISLVAVSPQGIWPFELLQAFLPHLAVAGVVLLIRSIALKSLFGAFAVMMGTALTTCFLHPYLPWDCYNDKDSTEFRTGIFNVYHRNASHSGTIDALLSADCDFMAVLEVSEIWDRVLSNGLKDTYPYAVTAPHAECCYGMSVYSKLPFEADTVMHFTRDPVIRVTLNIRGRATDLWAVHTRPPIFPNDTDERNMLMALVAAEIKKRDRPAILMGDLNIVPWAQDFKRMADTAELSDSRRGYLATYPMDLGIPLIPIDHILHSSEFSTTFCETVSIPGSDHKGLTVGLSIN
jgi:endonuclease/exonuclease/phosphatase (EEP) superfamily protein YafD